MAEAVLLLVAVLLLGSLAIRLVKKASDYYVNHYGFSLWAGAILIIVSLAFSILSAMSKTHISQSICTIAGLFLALFTLVQDIRLSSFPKGFGAFIIQIIIALFCVSMLFVLLARSIINRIVGRPSDLHRINPGVALGLYPGAPFRCFFTFNP